MRAGVPSETALKVAHSLISLSHTGDWKSRLPEGLGDLTAELMLAAELKRYSPGVIRAAEKPWMHNLYRMNDWFMPGLFEALGRRKIFMNDCALDAIEDGVEQIVVVGAGFDTMALRLAPTFEDVAFFEVDHPATAAAKHKAIDAIGKPDNVHLLAVDLAKTKIPEAMGESEAWSDNKPTLFIAEGLLMYLRNSQVRDLFAQTDEASGSGSRIAFSYCDPRWARSFRGGMSRAAVRMVGEPIQSWVSAEDLPRFLDHTDWVVSRHAEGESGEVERFAMAEKE